ncbi:hypothetical protein SUGI_1146860 [Cryptomeria japonica]|uniref:uncharacterized protein LOC131069726 n=1 Tax=Cryptomeria japonica TaxID=3369 RepID=UPI0024146D89|nr:uncharacterized protein LOC131069726 [Cryptomeria japonica]GLJ53744.1 hypothetical protein SUGI_1146860 [Cryptomeria japonica]
MAWRRCLSTALSRSWRPQPQHCLSFSSTADGVASSVDSVSKRRFTRKAISFVLLGVTGGFVLSAFDDFAVYHKCSSKALEKAISNERIQEAIGEPIARGAWYNATLALANKKNSVSCTFPIIGPKGRGIVQVKAVSCRENNWHDYLPGYLRWEIIFLEALVHAPTDEENTHTFRINLMKTPNLLENKDCKECKLVTS